MTRLRILIFTCLIAACGSDTPVGSGGILAEETVTLQPGQFRDYGFDINSVTQVNAELVIGIGTADPSLPIELLVMTEPNFPDWQATRGHDALVETATSGTNLTYRVPASGNYRLVVANRIQTVPTTYTLIADLFWKTP
jgi:hypothetical protein